MNQSIAHVALLVHDYDEAILFYTQKLNFIVVEDTILSETKRWVLIAPSNTKNSAAYPQLLLAKADNAVQKLAVGNQTGGRVFLFLYTDDFYRDYETMQSKGIEFVRPVSQEAYGLVSVWKDLYGNLWDLIEPNKSLT